MSYIDYLRFDPYMVVSAALKSGVAKIATKQRNPNSNYLPKYYQSTKEHRRVMKQIRRRKNIAMGLTGEGKPRSPCGRGRKIDS
jgi:hypothetical protein